MRKLSRYMLRRKVVAWGPLSSKHIIVRFASGGLAIINPRTREYSSVRAWNPANRLLLEQAARIPARGRLEDLLAMLEEVSS